MTPLEIIAGPLELWLAPEGEAFPDVDTAPAGNWVKVATSGDRNYAEDGVTVRHSQTIREVMTAGAMGAVKAFRESEALAIAVTILDVSLEQYKLALNGNTVTTTAAGSGTPGTKSIGLSNGETLTTYALLARGRSAYSAAMAAQYEVERCYQGANPQPVFRKGVPAGIALEFMALEDGSASSEAERFGRLIHQTAAAL
jgi:hypothetical protein